MQQLTNSKVRMNQKNLKCHAGSRIASGAGFYPESESNKLIRLTVEIDGER
jgi:hypothetical protein